VVELLVHYHACMIFFNRSCHQKTWVSVAKPNGRFTIYVDPQSCKPISDNLKTSKCMPPIQVKDTLTRIFNLGV
jgi:hypothetical protein